MGCSVKKRKDLRVCSGDMDKAITIYVRSITPPEGDSVDFNEIYSEPRNIKAMIETVRGITIFDGANVGTEVTHRITFRYVDNVTFENFIIYRNKRYKIVDVENQNERNNFYVLLCTDRGNDNLPATLI